MARMEGELASKSSEGMRRVESAGVVKQVKRKILANCLMEQWIYVQPK